MNYTENYHLPQWDKADRVLMEDFNQMCRDMEAGLNAAVQNGADAASAAQSAASQLAGQAQSTANAALSAANAAQTAADQSFKPGYLPYRAGSYTGNGATLAINLGFKPSFVILTGQYVYVSTEYVNQTVLAGPGGNMTSIVTFTNTGMELQPPSTNTPYFNLNQDGHKYSYIAFR